MRDELWRRCRRKPSYYLGFLASMPDSLPQSAAPRLLSESEASALRALADAGNPFAGQWLRICAAAGQTFVQTLLRVMEKPANQEVVSLSLEVVRDYFSPLRPEGDPDLTLEALQQQSFGFKHPTLKACLRAVPERERELRTLYLLSGVGYGVLRPVFSKSDAVGSLMRRKLEPLLAPLRQRLESLLG
jgi:hypothetical protein